MRTIVCRKQLLPFTLCFFLIALPVYAQNQVVPREDIWVCSMGEANLYSASNAAFGGGAALGYGDGVSLGLRVMYFGDSDNISTLELNFLLRFYLSRMNVHSGPFLQFSGGPVLFAPEDSGFSIPSEFGAVSAGLSFGWRFIIARYFFLEPTVRAGYPYAAGAGLSAGVRF